MLGACVALPHSEAQVSESSRFYARRAIDAFRSQEGVGDVARGLGTPSRTSLLIMSCVV